MNAQSGGYGKLVAQLGYQFRDEGLLRTALTHRSHVNENPGAGPHNERLEFIGDAVLGLAVAHLLMEFCPERSEGELSQLRSRLVSEPALAALARRLDLGQWLFLGRGEENNGGRYKPSLLADAYEAIMGAVYFDGGFPEVLALCRRLLGPELLNLTGGARQDFKSLLQEWVQGRHRTRPRYELLSEEGPSHDKTFEVAVWLEDRLVAQGRGKSKREAEQHAAEQALARLAAEAGVAPSAPAPAEARP
ncbi:MAG: ribonuclease III [Myxococcales bacterium]|nr:ribonuclease III [Myxococcota bacterium]MDW8284403.1 ribonuclease III [Myxococcales bacterium]